MKINTMGVTQALNLSTEGDLNPDMTLDTFNFEPELQPVRFTAHGSVVREKTVLYSPVCRVRERESEFSLNQNSPYQRQHL